MKDIAENGDAILLSLIGFSGKERFVYLNVLTSLLRQQLQLRLQTLSQVSALLLVCLIKAVYKERTVFRSFGVVCTYNGLSCEAIWHVILPIVQ